MEASTGAARGRWPHSYHAAPHPYHSNVHYAPAKKTCVFPEKTMNARRVTRYKPCFRRVNHPKPPTIFATCLSRSPAQSYPAPVAFTSFYLRYKLAPCFVCEPAAYKQSRLPTDTAGRRLFTV
ncbi:hypothetical protein HMPREF0742_02180 [Rothia aeria F0184]|uniref:Uncharacterized protein n=1 Tax=Rothia aeria F0184 TaxID=888019 RepID=U7UZT1_9MICC|nr:hypothetical protein HMPREF0742_02180 [Rothia aeria F0184]